MGTLREMFIKIDCFLEIHKWENGIEERTCSTIHYKQCRNCGERRTMFLEEHGDCTSDNFEINT